MTEIIISLTMNKHPRHLCLKSAMKSSCERQVLTTDSSSSLNTLCWQTDKWQL